MESVTRRNAAKLTVLGGAAVAGTGMSGLFSCGPNGVTINPAIIDAIQAAVAEACQFVPAVQTLLALVSMFPILGSATTITAAVLKQIADVLCTAYTAQSTGTAGHLKGPVMVGTVPVHGLHVGPDGKFHQF